MQNPINLRLHPKFLVQRSEKLRRYIDITKKTKVIASVLDILGFSALIAGLISSLVIIFKHYRYLLTTKDQASVAKQKLLFRTLGILTFLISLFTVLYLIGNLVSKKERPTAFLFVANIDLRFKNSLGVELNAIKTLQSLRLDRVNFEQKIPLSADMEERHRKQLEAVFNEGFSKQTIKFLGDPTSRNKGLKDFLNEKINNIKRPENAEKHEVLLKCMDEFVKRIDFPKDQRDIILDIESARLGAFVDFALSVDVLENEISIKLEPYFRKIIDDNSIAMAPNTRLAQWIERKVSGGGKAMEQNGV